MYIVQRSGHYQVYVQAFPDKHGKRQISGDSGSYPACRGTAECFFGRTVSLWLRPLTSGKIRSLRISRALDRERAQPLSTRGAMIRRRRKHRRSAHAG